MQTLAEQFFTAAEQEQISQTVRQVEQRTAGEIVPMVVSRSHSYPEAELTGALALAGPLALAVAHGLAALFWWPGEILWLFLAGLAVLVPLARLLLRRTPSLLRLFLWPARVEEEVARAALSHFYSQGLQATRESTGVLIYISVLERRVCILGDRGIHARLGAEAWQDAVDRLVAGIRDQTSCATLCAIIAEIGALLASHFPARADDRNELDDLIIADSATGGRGLLVS